jgi:hypothetical protein
MSQKVPSRLTSVVVRVAVLHAAAGDTCDRYLCITIILGDLVRRSSFFMRDSHHGHDSGVLLDRRRKSSEVWRTGSKAWLVADTACTHESPEDIAAVQTCDSLPNGLLVVVLAAKIPLLSLRVRIAESRAIFYLGAGPEAGTRSIPEGLEVGVSRLRIPPFDRESRIRGGLWSDEGVGIHVLPDSPQAIHVATASISFFLADTSQA